ncbi:hypothetical protein DMB38_25930 [Streptomyces sp. WAC 06738]|nr:hypothetical protein DMB38_25930 [Streptomyces sp. WAC 06738]
MPMPLQPNETLRRAIKESGYTQSGLADAVNDAHELLYGERGECSDRHIRRLLQGAVSWPKDSTRLSLQAVLGLTPYELGFRPPLPATRRVTVRRVDLPQDQDSPVYRRKFVLNVGTLVALPALPASGRIGMSDVERIHGAEARLVQLDEEHGGAGLVSIAGRYVEHIEHAIRHCTYGGRVQTALYRAVGEISAEAGWLAYDSQKHQEARAHWRTALQYARLGRATELEARIWSKMARQAVDLGHGSEAVGIARAALDATRGRRDPRLSALLHSRVALGHAAAGQAGRCAQSLHRAEQELDRATDEPPAWLAFCGPDEIAAQNALCHSSLGDHARAAQAAYDAVARTPPNEYRRNSFATRVSLARSTFAAGAADEALVAGHSALDLLPEVRSQRWVHELARFQRDVQRDWPAGAADFTERYRAVVA